MRFLGLIFFIVLSVTSLAQVRLGIDAQPIFYALGQTIGGDDWESPIFQGPQDRPLAFDISRWRAEPEVWMRYRLAMSLRLSKERIALPLLDDDLEPSYGEIIEDTRSTSSLYIEASIDREKIKGVNRLKFIHGRGIAASVNRHALDYDPHNPLESYLGDTLWTDSGYGLGLSAYLIGGISYSPWKNVSICARFDYGFTFQFTPESAQRSVVLNDGEAELIQRPTAAEDTRWSIDTRIRPLFVLAFTFPAAEAQDHIEP